MPATTSVELAFIEEELRRFNVDIERSMRQAMRALGVGVTDEGYQSIKAELLTKVSTQLSFHEYLRMRDMGAGRGSKLGISNDSTIANRTGRKPAQIYSKPVYGHLPRLVQNLVSNLTEETITRLKNQLTQPA